MPDLRNTRWERFAQFLADGKRPGQAYQLAGFGKSTSRPSALAKNPEIVARVGEITRAREEFKQRELQIAVERSAVSKTWVLERLKENAERAMQVRPVLDKEGNPTGEYQWNGFVANKALELLGRELGMFVERHELTLAQRLADMPEDQRAAEMFDLVTRARERLQQLRAVEQQTIERSATEVSASDRISPNRPEKRFRSPRPRC
jgi:hypothetical protein